MADAKEFNWDELPATIDEDKKAKRDTLTADEIPGAIQKMAQAATTSGKFHYQPLPHKDLADDFLKFIRAAGDFTEPQSTILAKLVTEYKDPKDGKTKKVTKGVMVRYSAGQRRGRKGEEEEGQDAAQDAANGSQDAAQDAAKAEGTDAK